ncbi:MAG: Ig-like domain-containing protein [Kofleriaceae bacterium]
MMRSLVAVAAVVGMGHVANAEPRRAEYREFHSPTHFKAAAAPAGVSHIIYLNRCTGGCQLKGSNVANNSTTNTTTIFSSGTKTVSAYSGTDAQWAQILSCVKATYAPFNVTITDQRPTSGDYHMAIVAGHAADVGEGTGVLGVSPFDCGNYIPNSISFSFANEEPTNIVDICWTVSQETAHSWGLDHKYDKLDPMTYLDNGNVTKVFQNQAGKCGEYSARQCSCDYNNDSGGSMNSYAEILATFGSGTPDTAPPTVSITSPTNNSQIQPGFTASVTASDDVGVTMVELRVDNNLVGTKTVSPYSFTGPSTLQPGAHHIEATAYDAAGNTAKSAVDVKYGETCTDTCSDSTQVCDNGVCVPGPDSSGGLGAPCTDNADCTSGSCGDDGAGHQYCVTTCDPANNTCPSGFGCLSAGNSGVCWPGADNGGGGGCNTGGGNNGLVLAGFALGAMLLTRKRR